MTSITDMHSIEDDRMVEREQQEKELQLCGHPRSAIVSSGEGRSYCGKCIEVPAEPFTYGDMAGKYRTMVLKYREESANVAILIVFLKELLEYVNHGGTSPGTKINQMLEKFGEAG